MKKEFDPIISLGDTDKLTVQKSLPLFALWKSELTLSEFKILDLYLSRINSRNPNRRTVILEKGEMEKVFGVDRIRIEDLKPRLKHLMGNVVEIPDKDFKNGFTMVTLFEEANAMQNDNGLWTVNLTCTPKAMKYFFNVENLGYLRYKLRSITSMTSRYTYVMFMYIESNRFRKTWTVSLDDMKKILHCENDEYTKEFKRFNDRVLKKCQKEILEKTECRYTYETIRKGRKVDSLKFTVQTLKDLITPDAESADIFNMEVLEDTPLWYNAVAELNLSDERLDELRSYLACIPVEKLPNDPTGDNNIDYRWFHYLDQKVKQINVLDKEKKIRSKYKYLLTIVKRDAGEQ